MIEITDTDRLDWISLDGHHLAVGYDSAYVTTLLGTYEGTTAREAIDKSILADIAHAEEAVERGG